MAKKQPLDMDAILEQKTPNVATVRLCIRPELIDERDRTEAQFKRVRLEEDRDNLPPKESVDLARRVEELEQKVRDTTVEFLFQALHPHELQALQDDWPPREVMGDDGNPQVHPDDRDAGVNAAEWPARLIAAASVSPKINVKQAKRVLTEWADAEAAALLSAARNAQTRVRSPDFI